MTADESTAADEYEQTLDVVPSDDDTETDDEEVLEADPADVAEQRRVVPLDEDDV